MRTCLCHFTFTLWSIISTFTYPFRNLSEEGLRARPEFCASYKSKVEILLINTADHRKVIVLGRVRDRLRFPLAGMVNVFILEPERVSLREHVTVSYFSRNRDLIISQSYDPETFFNFLILVYEHDGPSNNTVLGIIES